MKRRGVEYELKEQLVRELTAILDGYSRDAGAGCIDEHPSELSRLRHSKLSRFSLGRVVRYIARAGYDVVVSLKKTPRLEQRPQPRRPCSTVVRYDYYGRVTTLPGSTARRDG
jgi:hypothetical protein